MRLVRLSSLGFVLWCRAAKLTVRTLWSILSPSHSPCAAPSDNIPRLISTILCNAQPTAGGLTFEMKSVKLTRSCPGGQRSFTDLNLITGIVKPSRLSQLDGSSRWGVQFTGLKGN